MNLKRRENLTTRTCPFDEVIFITVCRNNSSELNEELTITKSFITRDTFLWYTNEKNLPFWTVNTNYFSPIASCNTFKFFKCNSFLLHNLQIFTTIEHLFTKPSPRSFPKSVRIDSQTANLTKFRHLPFVFVKRKNFYEFTCSKPLWVFQDHNTQVLIEYESAQPNYNVIHKMSFEFSMKKREFLERPDLK